MESVQVRGCNANIWPPPTTMTMKQEALAVLRRFRFLPYNNCQESEDHDALQKLIMIFYFLMHLIYF